MTSKARVALMCANDWYTAGVMRSERTRTSAAGGAGALASSAACRCTSLYCDSPLMATGHEEEVRVCVYVRMNMCVCVYEYIYMCV